MYKRQKLGWKHGEIITKSYLNLMKSINQPIQEVQQTKTGKRQRKPYVGISETNS